MQLYRQGDVLVMKVDQTRPQGLKAVKRSRGACVLAEGEVTGHFHGVFEEDAELFDCGRDDLGSATEKVADDAFVAGWLTLPSAGQLKHQEHATIDLPAGDYVVLQQREYAPEAIRRVVD